MTGNDVLELIANLRTLGFSIPATTATMSPAVIAAVVSIQGTENLEVDGIYGPLTHAAVGSLIASKKLEARNSPTTAVAVEGPNEKIEAALRGIAQRLDSIDENVPKRINAIRRQLEVIRKENQ